MRLLASSRLAALALVALVAAAGCAKDNPNFCEGAACPTDAAIDVPIDTPPIVGCSADPGVCVAPIDTCVNDECSDCNAGLDLDVQSAACTTVVAPICRAGNACGACTDHEECTSGVCFQGTCATGVLFVDDNGDDGGNNTCLNPLLACATLTRALSLVPPIGVDPNGNRRFIRMQTVGTYAEPGSVTIDAKSVWIVAPPQSPPLIGARAEIDRSGNGPVMTIANGSEVQLVRLGVNNGAGNTAGDGVTCSGSTVVALGIEAFSNEGTGIVTDACQLTVIGSVIANNLEGGVSVAGGRAVIVNDVVVANGGATSAFGGISLAASVATTSVLQSNTVVNNLSSTATETNGIDCRIAGVIGRNNIVYGDGTRPRVNGACTHQNTLYGPTDLGALLGVANGNMLVLSDSDFKFANPGARNYRLQITTPASVAKDKGSTTGLAAEAMKDIDEEMRPQGTADVGCDEIP